MSEVIVNKNIHKVEFNEGSGFRGKIDDEDFSFVIKSDNSNNYSILKDNSNFDIDIISVDIEKKQLQIMVNGKTLDIIIEDKYDLIVNKLGLEKKKLSNQNNIKAMMPGLVIDIHVSKGDSVLKGQNLLTLEAMKMENIIKSSGDFIIKNILVRKGQTVEKDDTLFEF